MLLLDFSSVAVSTVMAQAATFEEQPEMVRHTIFNIIRRFNVEHRDQFGEMIVCFDSKNNWRKDTFPQYKANRKKTRDNSDMDWKAIYELINATKEELKTYSPYRCIEVERCEADDVIGTICHKNMTPEPILIVSPDRDFVQLQQFPNVKQYSNIQKKWIEAEVDPVSDLQLKVLKGDTGDGIPNVLSDDLTFVEGRRQGVLNKKKQALLLENPESMGVSVSRNYIRNRNMIDLSRTPEDLQSEIMQQFDKKPNGSIMRLMTLFTKHRMNMLLESLNDFEVRTL